MSTKARFNQVLSNYQTGVRFGANYTIIAADLWGADGGEPSDAHFPGDNGDWSEYDQFLARVISDLKANKATKRMTFDVWNEPDLTYAWNRTQQQYLQMWGRGVAKIRYVGMIDLREYM